MLITQSKTHGLIVDSTPEAAIDALLRLDELELTGYRVETSNSHTFVYCSPATVDPFCPGCAEPGRPRGNITATLIDLPVTGYPLKLIVRILKIPLCQHHLRTQGLPSPTDLCTPTSNSNQ